METAKEVTISLMNIIKEDQEAYDRLHQQYTECDSKRAMLVDENTRLKQQLAEANEIIEEFRTYDFTVTDERAEEYMVNYGVSGKRIYTHKNGSNNE